MTSCPASCSRPATVLLSTPPDIATTMRMRRLAAGLLVQEISAASRQPYDQSVQRLGHHDLAAEARCLLEAEGEIQHVLLVLGRPRQLAEPSRVHDNVAS